MARTMTILFAIINLIGINEAYASCKLAVGGPSAHPTALAQLSSSIETMLKNHKDYKAEVFLVSSLPDAVALEADYILFLKGDASKIEFQFRDLLMNSILFRKIYYSTIGKNEVITSLTAELENNVVKKGHLARFCR